MSEETLVVEETPTAKVEGGGIRQHRTTKRDIVRFNGETSTAINLDHCISIVLNPSEKTIVFHSAKKDSDRIQFESEASAASVYEIIMKMWGGDDLA